jgi:putative phosphoesterase
MKIGILSDSHGQQERMKRAIDLLRRQGAEYFIHCGDLGGMEMLDLLAGLPSAFVWGNCDCSRAPLEAYATQLGIRCFGSVGKLNLGGRQVAFTHGDDHRAMVRIVSGREADYLLYGHTHAWDDRREGSVRLINPGALHRVARKTVALLDTERDSVVFIEVPDAA